MIKQAIQAEIEAGAIASELGGSAKSLLEIKLERGVSWRVLRSTHRKWRNGWFGGPTHRPLHRYSLKEARESLIRMFHYGRDPLTGNPFDFRQMGNYPALRADVVFAFRMLARISRLIDAGDCHLLYIAAAVADGLREEDALVRSLVCQHAFIRRVHAILGTTDSSLAKRLGLDPDQVARWSMIEHPWEGRGMWPGTYIDIVQLLLQKRLGGADEKWQELVAELETMRPHLHTSARRLFFDWLETNLQIGVLETYFLLQATDEPDDDWVWCHALAHRENGSRDSGLAKCELSKDQVNALFDIALAVAERRPLLEFRTRNWRPPDTAFTAA